MTFLLPVIETSGSSETKKTYKTFFYHLNRYNLCVSECHDFLKVNNLDVLVNTVYLSYQIVADSCMRILKQEMSCTLP